MDQIGDWCGLEPPSGSQKIFYSYIFLKPIYNWACDLMIKYFYHLAGVKRGLCKSGFVLSLSDVVHKDFHLYNTFDNKFTD